MRPIIIKIRAPKMVVVLPCYNEAQRLDIDAFESFFGEAPGVTLLFVDDGSTDDTPLLLERIRQRAPGQVCTLRLNRNRGKAEAVRRGIQVALRRQPSIVGYWDADLSTPLQMIPHLAEVLQTRPAVQLVMGSRVAMLGRQIRRSPLRHFLGRLFATAASTVLRLPVYDSQCGAKLIRVTPQTAELFSLPFRSRWIFDVELLARIASARRPSSESPRDDGIFYEQPLDRWHDVAGSHLRLRDCFAAAGELLAIYWRYTRNGFQPSGPLSDAIKLHRVDDDQHAAA
ncbi:MAG TPA: glycosyltransferase [Lacipirellulaceae bacterium]|nr:glycosyltransferase [Lacipirellulaceae bacterium]